MPRVPRRLVTRGGRVFHVTSRGVDGCRIVHDDHDRQAFAALVREVGQRDGLSFRGVVLSAGAVHLVVECEPAALSIGMRRLLGRYAQRFNLRHGRRGHLFGDRFTSRVIGRAPLSARGAVATGASVTRTAGVKALIATAPAATPAEPTVRPPPSRARGQRNRDPALHWPSVLRHRTARSAVLGVGVRRRATGQPPPRTTAALRRRMVVGVLVVLALVLVTLSFRDSGSGPVARVQDAGATALRPFQVAAERVARPFRDVYSWFDGLLDARSDADRLRAENERLRQALIRNEAAARENATLKALLDYREGPSFPGDYVGLAASVIARPASAFAQAVVVSVGSKDGVALNAPVVTADGLVGLVTRVSTRSSRVTLLTDEQSAVSAIDVKTSAAGIVRHGSGTGSTLVLDRVPKEDAVRVGDPIVTAGWRSSRLASLYPKGIPIGSVTSVGQTDTDLYKQVQVKSYADFTSLDAVVVLVRAEEGATPP